MVAAQHVNIARHVRGGGGQRERKQCQSQEFVSYGYETGSIVAGLEVVLSSSGRESSSRSSCARFGYGQVKLELVSLFLGTTTRPREKSRRKKASPTHI